MNSIKCMNKYSSAKFWKPGTWLSHSLLLAYILAMLVNWLWFELASNRCACRERPTIYWETDRLPKNWVVTFTPRPSASELMIKLGRGIGLVDFAHAAVSNLPQGSWFWQMHVRILVLACLVKFWLLKSSCCSLVTNFFSVRFSPNKRGGRGHWEVTWRLTPWPEAWYMSRSAKFIFLNFGS